MKVFVNKLATFTILLLLTIFCFLFLSILFARQNIEIKAREDSVNIVLGHSHPECAYNDEYIDDFENFAQSAEAYLYTYIKLKSILETSPNVENIFLEFTNNQIQIDMDEWFWGDVNLSSRLSRYSTFFSLEDFLLLNKGNPKEVAQQIPNIIKRNLGFIKNGNKNYNYLFGGYKRLERMLDDSIVGQLESKSNQIKRISSEISKMNLGYLLKIIDLSLEKRKNIFLIRTPFNERYLWNKNQDLYNEILKDDLAGVKYLDFSKFKLNLCEMADTQHLNSKGAMRYSIWFNDFLKLGSYKQNTIDSLINLIP